MEGIVYHGNKKEKGLTELDPNKSKHESSHGNKFIYASQSKEMAMFMSMRVTDWYSLVGGEGTIEDPAFFVERLPGIFEEYLHSSTNIYTLDAKDFYQRTSWNGEVVADKKQQILSEEHIEDVYSELEKSEKMGKVKLYHYPDRPEWMPLDNSDLIEHIVLPMYRATHNLNVVDTLLQTYPNLFSKILTKSLVAEPSLFINIMKKIYIENINKGKKKIKTKLQQIKNKINVLNKEKVELLPSGKVDEQKTFENVKTQSEEKKSWELEPTEKARIQSENVEIAKKHSEHQNEIQHQKQERIDVEDKEY